MASTDELRKKNPFPLWMTLALNYPLRRFHVRRQKYLDWAKIKEGSIVFELGCGPGFFTEAISKRVGLKGSVTSQDIEPKMLEKMQKRVNKLSSKNNVKAMLTPSNKIELADNSVDIIFAANVFEEIEDEGDDLLKTTIKELNRILKPGSILFFKEHKLGESRHEIEEVKEELEKIFQVEKKWENLFSHFEILKKA